MTLAAYTLGRVLGEGGMGRVVAARHRELGTEVAIKELTARAPEMIDLFRAEARLLFGLKHPAFPTVKDFFEQDGRFYLVMDLVRGEPLDARIYRGGPVPAPELLAIARSAAQALAVLHAAGIVHRDVKPANVIVQPGGSIVLVDFGIARAASSPRTEMAARGALTPCFAPPEQYASAPSTPAVDLYGLGATLYHAATGVLPLDACVRSLASREVLPPVRARRSDLDAALEQAIARCLALDPAARPPSAAQLAADLGAPLSAATGPAQPSARAQDTFARQRRLDIRRPPR